MIGILFSACEEEFVIVTETEEEGEKTTELVTTTIEGNVLDLGTLPLSNISVDLSVDNAILASTSTDAEGRFTLENVRVSEAGSLLIFNHPDYSTSYRLLAPQKDLSHFTEMKMLNGSQLSFIPDEAIQYEDEMISFNILSSQIENPSSSNLDLYVNTIEKEKLAKHKLVPINGLQESLELSYLDHRLIFQLEIYDNVNNKEIQILKGESFELNIKSQIDLETNSVWRFNIRDAVWQMVDLSMVSGNQLSLDKTGLYTIAKSLPSYLLSGIITNNSGNVVSNAKVIITDESGKIINEVFTNTDGYYECLVSREVKGRLEIINDGNPSVQIDFKDITDPALENIELTGSPTCKSVELDILPFSCKSELRPSDLFDGDVSDLKFFGLELTLDGTINNYGVLSADELFENLPWESLLSKTRDYKVTYIDEQSGIETSCANTITVTDKIPPAMVCTEKLTSQLGPQNTVEIFAQDIDDGSNDPSCGQDQVLILEIARIICDENENCEEGEFGPIVQFNEADSGKELGVILKGTDNNGNSNKCWATIKID